MEQTIKIAVMGGSGKAGKYLVRQLIHQGFPLKVLHRNPKNFPINSPLIEVVKGDARDAAAIHSLVAGCQAVISTLGQPKGEPPIFSEATRNVISAMDKYNVHCYILITGLNVDTPTDRKSPQTKMATDWMKTNYPETTADKQEEYNMLSASNIQWTLVRLPLIELTEERRRVVVSLEDCPGEKISATDLAHFLIAQLTEKVYIRKAPFIGNV
jgi:putative NADH-flavin reductase